MELNFVRTFTLTVIINVYTHSIYASNCGCKSIRPCYQQMLDTLQDGDEVSCIEYAYVASSTVTVFLKAIEQFCGNITKIFNEHKTYQERVLYEVVISSPNVKGDEDDRPVIIIDAGQEAGSDSVGLALYLIEQLVMCQENHEQINKVRWVILPCTNPDGLEFSRFKPGHWRKNLRPSMDEKTMGVDISRNFDGDWSACPSIATAFSPIFQGPGAASENETIFIKHVLNKYKNVAKAYLSIRRDGHSISYPYGSEIEEPQAVNELKKGAGAITTRINHRAGSVHVFSNKSIYQHNGKPRCGHSVDYAHRNLHILHSYEMRVFLETANKIMAEFQTLPRGYEAALRRGYYSGIQELFNIVTDRKTFKST